MNKKGVMTWEELVAASVGIVLLLVAFWFLASLTSKFLIGEEHPVHSDLERFSDNIKSLEQDDSALVFSSYGKEYSLKLFIPDILSKSEQNICSRRPCLCAYEDSKLLDCVIVESLYACSLGKSDLCIDQNEFSEAAVTPNSNIRICSASVLNEHSVVSLKKESEQC